jgi:hypothetical protein
MKTLIAYVPSSRAYLRWIETGKPARYPHDVPIFLPDEAEKNDRYLIFVGGIDRTFVGHGRVTTNWRKEQLGGWKGHWKIEAVDTFFREPVAFEDVSSVTGFSMPKDVGVVRPEYSALVWAAVHRRPLPKGTRTIEGIRTESVSKSRNPALRVAALQRAKGSCECCGKNYRRVAGGLGERCLVVHHKKQLKDSDQPVETRLTDLAVVCANCHMMIHADSENALSLAALRRRLKTR